MNKIDLIFHSKDDNMEIGIKGKSAEMISIVLCTYNRAHTLRDTINSILGQTYKDFELIIVDDGSTDSTWELLSEYNDDRIRIFRQKENQFYCAAVNYGIEQALGEYLAFATSDDTWEARKLDIQISFLQSRIEYGACFTFSDVIDEYGKPADREFDMLSGLLIKDYKTQKEWIQHFIYEGNCLCHPSALIRREVINDIGGFNLMYCQSGDMELWLRLVRRYPIYVIEEKMVHYRCYKNPLEQVSGADEMKSARFLNEHMIIRKRFIDDLSDQEMILFFGEHFQNPQSKAHLEVAVEKALLLMTCTRHLPGLRVLGMEKLEELLRLPGMLGFLKEKFGVSVHDIYEWNREHFYMDFGIHVKLSEQEQMCREFQKSLEEQILVQEEQRLILAASEKDREKKDERIRVLEDCLDQAALENLKLQEELDNKRRGKKRGKNSEGKGS